MERHDHTRPGIPASPYHPLSDAEVSRIADATFRLLEKSGMAVHSPTAFDAYIDAGAQGDRATGVVKLPRSLVEDAIDSSPSSITLYSRDAECDAVLEKNRVHYGTGGTAIYVLDPDTGERRQSNRHKRPP